MKKQRIAFAFPLTYLWMMMILLGSIVLETFMVYTATSPRPRGRLLRRGWPLVLDRRPPWMSLYQ